MGKVGVETSDSKGYTDVRRRYRSYVRFSPSLSICVKKGND